MWLAIRSLSAADQRIVELCLIESHPTSSVAIALGMPVGTVKAKLFRARKKLRVDLEEFAPKQEVASA